MPQTVEFEWHISDPEPDGQVFVRERLVGSDHHVNIYGPMPRQLTDTFIRARRDFVHRVVTTRAGAIQIFTPRPNLSILASLQQKAKHDDD